jgi:hypothetical protein
MSLATLLAKRACCDVSASSSSGARTNIGVQRMRAKEQPSIDALLRV